jgi:CDP-glucose 4,6-dehydratase
MAVRQRTVEGLEMTPDFWRGKRVFLTGHTGFKGSWLSLWLTEVGAEISGYALAPSTEPSLFDRARIAERLTNHVIADVRDLDALRQAMRTARPEIAIHMAAQPLVRYSYNAPIETYAVNVLGTAHFLEAAREADTLKAVLCITTDKCYENIGTRRGYREDDALGGHDPYSSSKAGSELVISAYRRSFFETLPGAPLIASGRAGNVIGGGDWSADRLIVDLMKAFMTGQKPVIRSPKAVRPWQHVLEPLSGYLTLCEALWNRQPGAASAFNFGPGPEDAKPVSWIADRISQLWGNSADWTLDTSVHHPHEAHYLYLDTTKAMTELGYQPHWKLELALSSIVDWYRSFAAGKDAAALTLEQIAQFQSAQNIS